MNRIEALLDALITVTGYSEPDSQEYRFRNPLGLKVFCEHHCTVNRCAICKGVLSHTARRYTNGTTVERKYDPESGLRIYGTHIQGYQSGLHDLKIKCIGQSHSKIRHTSTIKELVRSYYLPDGSDLFVAGFLKRALEDESISENTAIEYFLTTEDAGTFLKQLGQRKEAANGER